jgi:hypothetical protein
MKAQSTSARFITQVNNSFHACLAAGHTEYMRAFTIMRRSPWLTRVISKLDRA